MDQGLMLGNDVSIIQGEDEKLEYAFSEIRNSATTWLATSVRTGCMARQKSKGPSGSPC
jgi:hypothetical protein